MAGETKAEVSGWTVDTSRAADLQFHHERDRRYEQRFQAQEKAVAAALEAQQTATNKSDATNAEGFRQIGNQIDELVKFVQQSEGKARARQTDWGFVIGAGGVVVAIIAIWMTYSNTKIERNTSRLEAQQQQIPVPVTAPSPLPVKPVSP